MFAPPPPADTADVAQARADAVDGVDFPVRATADRAPYLGVLRGSPGILAAMDYANLPQDCRIGIWDAIDNYDVDGTYAPAYPGDSGWPANSDGMPPGYDRDNPLMPPFYYVPQGGDDHQGIVDLTRPQAIDSFGAKVAHALYHEAQGTFPWTLSRYSNAELLGLFDPVTLFSDGNSPTWDLGGGSPTASYRDRIIDHVPQEAFDTAVGFMGAPATALEALANIQDNALQDMIHVVFGDVRAHPLWSIKVADVFYPVDRAEWIARAGCHTAAYICIALARSINIPAVRQHGWYAGGGGHCTVHYPTVDRTWLHGDHIYETEAINPPWFGLSNTGRYSEWVANVDVTAQGSYEADMASGRLDALLGLHIPHAQIVATSQKVLFGKNYFLALYERYFNPAEVATTLEQIWANVVSYIGSEPTESRVYGRMEINAADQDASYFAPTPWGAGDPTPNLNWKGDLHSTAQVGTHYVIWPDPPVGFDPLPKQSFDVLQDQTTVVGPPVYPPEKSITILTEEPTISAQYEISPNPFTGVGTYGGFGSVTGTVTLQGGMLENDYTLTWLDNYAGYDPPTPPTEGPFTLLHGGTISFGPPTYVAE